ncbi:uncharacterized protein LOC132207723 isoform X1 [Stegostoma tigrinum]|uniref:uncharacterized protein LOC132207723 isoform X1 n=1 Tax=Stegostoma tigrinum TaxID=3053191 RepID=UPI00286FC5BD|nr:uncharacterized protein LOC132207723 isoform X1 [Stegostoma tigrinum]
MILTMQHRLRGGERCNRTMVVDFTRCSTTLTIVIPIVLSYQSVCIPGRMCSYGLRSCGGHGSGTAVSSPYAAEPAPEERAQRIAKAVRKQSIEVKENWEQLKIRASNWQKQVEKALEKLQELLKALDDLEAHVITAEGVHTDWQPVSDLLIDSLQDHIDKTTAFLEQVCFPSDETTFRHTPFIMRFQLLDSSSLSPSPSLMKGLGPKRQLLCS